MERIPYGEGAPYFREFVIKRTDGIDSWITKLKPSEKQLPLFFKVEAHANGLTIPILIITDAFTPSATPGVPSDDGSITVDFYRAGVLKQLKPSTQKEKETVNDGEKTCNCKPTSEPRFDKLLVSQKPHAIFFGKGFTDPKQPIFSLPKLKQVRSRKK